MTGGPYVPFYTSDFLAGTSGMTAGVKGVYITLLCLIYEAERPLKQRYATLARRCGASNSAFKMALDDLVCEGKINLTEDGIWSEKCEKHLTYRREMKEKNAKAAKVRWKKSQQKQRQGNASAMQAQCQPEPEPNISVTNVTGDDVAGQTDQNDLGQEPVVDAQIKAIWTRGVPFLKDCGVSDPDARKCLGMWLRDHGGGAVFNALAEAKRAGTGDPISYIQRVLHPKDRVDQDEVWADVMRSLKFAK